MPPQCAWPEHHDMLDLERLTANSSAAETAVLCAVRRIGRHQVGDVAHHEQFAGTGVEDHLRRHARIAAADHHDFRRSGRLPPIRDSGSVPLAGGRRESDVAGDQTFGKAHATYLPAIAGQFNHAQIAILSPYRSSGGGSGNGCASPAWIRRATATQASASSRSSRPAPGGGGQLRPSPRKPGRHKQPAPQRHPRLIGRLLTFFGSVRARVRH